MSVPGITVATTVVVSDPSALGRTVALLSSQEQAEFLAGLAAGFESFGPIGAAQQAQYIADALAQHPAESAVGNVTALLESLLSRVGGGPRG